MLHVMLRSDWKQVLTETQIKRYQLVFNATWTYMDHVLWEGLYADRVRTNWCFGTKAVHFQGKCIEIHVGYEKETREINRCGDE